MNTTNGQPAGLRKGATMVARKSIESTQGGKVWPEVRHLSMCGIFSMWHGKPQFKGFRRGLNRMRAIPRWLRSRAGAARIGFWIDGLLFAALVRPMLVHNLRRVGKQARRLGVSAETTRQLLECLRDRAIRYFFDQQETPEQEVRWQHVLERCDREQEAAEGRREWIADIRRRNAR